MTNGWAFGPETSSGRMRPTKDRNAFGLAQHVIDSTGLLESLKDHLLDASRNLIRDALFFVA